MVQGYPGQTNTLYRGEGLATADDRNLVRPNVDTIYSCIFYDLAKSDLEFTIPEISDRCWCFPFYDLYGDNFGNIGSLQAWKAGKYLLTLTDDDFSVSSENIPGQYQGCVKSPTPYGLALIRILANDREADMAHVIELQKKISFKPVKRLANTNIPSLDLRIFPKILNDQNISKAESVFQLLAALAHYNPPEVLNDRVWVADMLKHAGISNGHFRKPKDTDMEAAAEAATTSSINIRRLAGMTDNLGNDWTKTAAHILGGYGSYYNGRHIAAIRGYLALTIDQAFYPVYTAGNPTVAYEYKIGPQEAYLVTFSSKPKLIPTGFWSVTAYGGDGYLIPNQLNRCVLGDRANLQYPDGCAVYSGNDKNKSRKDQSFQVLLQPSDIPPPKKWLSNWLPAPAGGGSFSFSLRFYGATESLANGEWEYPVIQKMEVIRQ
ncbi:hypothetical protein V496_10590 [Pseudogymnoascus sp. VKM F-4515 (FW-2607)]|nr:hypothetical protein V496_10590 [Pseudogymnoascus sp. VKM F-4515 (FW-2607)]